ncbi:helicase-exonuclease AddAB subunit AddA [Salipaludibacillus neizhouensis]|uniref:ATP-dependent helicase/nuclease subunit A n=1 Tax=Salipaludibacillus neizhouensis TaxID=885475 RepID=A0A3A9KCH5_9BACI|nr:helicase-exonuclease AddAB subunit AddA [Salipaludibacillus neizhouensis]RKL69348.1 helicase-exonuclease AddAB subunit AddA [Salipaludibacillus neizhouensis]
MNIEPKPNNVSWTDDQWKAIAAEGNNILVAAAAGSGKTAVLVERIIRKIVDVENPTDVDKLLIVTFTNAAAAEMRHRIGEAIEKQIHDDPRSLHLRRQLSLLHRANISTLHSFCMNVVRKFYYDVDIDPSFRILDQTEGQLIREEILEDLFEEEYGAEDNQSFFTLVDQYSGDRTDDKLRSLVMHLFDFSRSNPQPFQWLDDLVSTFKLEGITSIEELSWASSTLENVRRQLESAKDLLQQALEMTREPDGPAKYAETLETEYTQIQTILSAKTWEEMFQAFSVISFPTIPRITKKDLVDDQLKEKTKALRDQAKDILKTNKKAYFQYSPEVLLADLTEMAPSIEKLTTLVKDFSARYLFEKRDKGVLDFSDLEHLCLEVLIDQEKSSLHGPVPSKAAEEYIYHFNEIMVDEYQDTNLVQETILTLLSNGKNLFMVGDVKQSIYRFRLAEPTLFMNKYKLFDLDGDKDGLRIDLAKNFRSRSQVLDATNFIFRQIMDEEVGEITYNDVAELKLGNTSYPDQANLETRLMLVNKGDKLTQHSEEESEEPVLDMEEELETSQLEARAMIQEIKQLIQSKNPVMDKATKQSRPIRYRDIVILMRSMPWADTIMEECKTAGIPVYAELSTGYFEAIEVKIMVSLLKIIDNPYQDIPLASVLRSPILNFTEEELSKIRILDKQSRFYDTLKLAGTSENQDESIKNRCASFIEQLTQWRKKARSGSLSELIWQLFRETGFYDYVGGMPAGKQRRANLRALYDRSRSYESTSFRGLFRFLRFVERMQDRGDDLGTARALSEQEDVIRIMTIHKSKGLEFPVVFMAGTNKMFNQQDLRGDYLLHKELGLGSKRIDPELRLAYPTIPQQVIKNKIRSESLAEEMRVLYVALTRAKEKLYLVGTLKDVDKSLEKWTENIDNQSWLLPNIQREKARSFLDWIAPSVLRHHDAIPLLENHEIDTQGRATQVSEDPSSWLVDILEKAELQVEASVYSEVDQEIEQQLLTHEPVNLESSSRNKVLHHLEWSYPRQDSVTHRAKQSVSELKRAMQDEYSDDLMATSFQSKFADRPKFLQKNSFRPAEKGTLMHTMMQHVSLVEEHSLESLERQLLRLVTKEIITLEESEQINLEHLHQFFQNSLGKQLIAAKNVWREIPFSYLIPASQAYSTWSQQQDETVFVQGMIDCVFRNEEGKLVLLDYKTDTITGKFTDKTEEEILNYFKDLYHYQVDLYSQALADSWHEAIEERYLYFFDGNYLVKM